MRVPVTAPVRPARSRWRQNGIDQCHRRCSAMVRGLFLPLTLALALLVVATESRPAATPSQNPPTSQQQPVFTATVNFVQLDVIVRDDKGRFVPGLTTADFKVFEDNVPQTIGVFKPFIGGRNTNPGAAPVTSA